VVNRLGGWEDFSNGYPLKFLNTNVKVNFPILTNNGLKFLLKNAPNDEHYFDTVVFPIVRRVFSGLLSNDIVAIQPMGVPNGQLFYMSMDVGMFREKWGLRIIKSTLLDY